MSPKTEAALLAAIEKNGLTFHIKTGNARWQCTLLDRATHEKRKASKNSSASSVDTAGTPSAMTSSSSASTASASSSASSSSRSR